jgi:hypothetical protein
LLLALVIEGLVMLGEQAQAAHLYPLVRELVGTEALALGRSSASHRRSRVSARQWEAAEDHFQIALQ